MGRSPGVDPSLLGCGLLSLVIDRRMLTHCPNLATLTLKDNTMVYYCRDLVPCLPADLSRIKKMQLKGWSAVTFDAVTLHTTPNLANLSITMHCVYLGMQYIPPQDELDQSFGIVGDATITTGSASAADAAIELTAPAIPRAVWTWNWHLPKLKTLTLTVEFALRFQFRMLQGCPSLHTLFLDSYSNHKTHIRTITVADLFAPTNVNDNGDIGQGTSSARIRIVAPSLRTLTISGHWVVSDAILSDFLTGMFPELQDLTMARWSGCTLEGFVDMIKTATTTTGTNPSQQPKRANKFRTLRLDFPVTSSKELLRLGLWKCGSGGYGKADVAARKGEPVFYLDRRDKNNYYLV